MKQKGIAPIVVVIIFAAIFIFAGAGYWYSASNKKVAQEAVIQEKVAPEETTKDVVENKPEEKGVIEKMVYSDEYIRSTLENPTLSISDWQIYKNISHGFQISYPPGYVVAQERADFVQFVEERYLNIEGEVPSLTINIRQNNGNITIDEWFKQNSKLYSGNFPIEHNAITNIISLTVSRKPARAVVLKGLGELVVTVLANGNTVLDIQAHNTGSFSKNQTLLERYAASLQSIRHFNREGDEISG